MRLVGYAWIPAHVGPNHLRQQEAALLAWARSKGHELIAVVHDEALTERSESSRHGLHEALNLIAERRASGLAVDQLETLSRMVPVQEAILALVWWHGGSVFTLYADEAAISGEPLRQHLRQLAGSLLRLEREVAAARSTARRRRLLARGGYAGGAPAFGSRAVGKRLEIDPVERVVLGRIAELRQAGLSLRQIARTLDAEGHRPKRSDHWHPESLRRILVRLEADQDSRPRSTEPTQGPT